MAFTSFFSLKGGGGGGGGGGLGMLINNYTYTYFYTHSIHMYLQHMGLLNDLCKGQISNFRM